MWLLSRFHIFQGFGIDAMDFVEAKYIHVGFLYFMACLVILLPLVWLVWPIRSKLPDFRLMTRRRILRET
jgi:hypothetical protein